VEKCNGRKRVESETETRQQREIVGNGGDGEETAGGE